MLSEYWFECDWTGFFDLLEHVADLIATQHRETRQSSYGGLNHILEAQGCAYRFITEKLAPLTNPAEVSEVARAAESAIPAVASHIREALSLLPPSSDASPRNSVKESISAVEAALKVLGGDASATLTTGLSAFEAKFGELHPALRAGLVKLYGYTSDEKGVRHALVDEAADVTVDDARFMVVICSAFANYLVALSSSAAAMPR
jgi:AbiJ N-terminal domain 4